MSVVPLPTRSSFFHRNKGLILMISPCVLFFLLFQYLPMLGAVVAFKDYIMREGILRSPWIGLDNFRRLFGSSDFLQALRNTLVISLLRLAFGFFAPIILALLLNEIRISAFKRTIQTLTYIPHFLSWIILGGIFLMVFSLDGPVNHLVTIVSNKPISFLSDDAWFITILILTGIWSSAGFGAIIYLAALSGISPTLYEAAVVDGANRWQQTRHVTLPGLAPTIVVLLILNVGGILDAGFDQIYNMYNPMVYGVADIIDTYTLRRLMGMDIGLATAAGLFKSVVGMTLVVTVNAIARRMSNGEQGLW
jgi:putative aldouronate transport system permease protein